MLPTDKFCFVRNGQILEGPFVLPNQHRRTAGLRSLPLKQLKEMGYYPVQYTCPSCWGNFEFLVDEENKVVIAQPKERTVEEFKGRGRSNIEINHNAINNLYVEFGKVRYRLDIETITLLLAGITLEKIMRIPARTEKDAYTYPELSYSQQKILLNKILEMRNNSMSVLDERSKKVENATSFDDVFEAIG